MQNFETFNKYFFLSIIKFKYFRYNVKEYYTKN